MTLGAPDKSTSETEPVHRNEAQARARNKTHEKARMNLEPVQRNEAETRARKEPQQKHEMKLKPVPEKNPNKNTKRPR